VESYAPEFSIAGVVFPHQAAGSLVVVDGKVIVETKSVAELHSVHKRQLLTYLRLSNARLGLLINFNVPLIKDGIRRLVR